jgi:acyl-CoA synthetase (NDP forming)
LRQLETSASDRRRRGDLRALLAPRSVTIVGASDDPSRIGGRPLRYMRESGFSGPIYPVNPNRATVQGLPAFASVGAVPEPADCAIVAVPAPLVGAALEECAAHGVGSAIVFSSGFAETGAAGAAEQARLGELARRTGMRILGPNCLGVLSFASRFFATFSSTGDGGFTAPGPLAIVSQSGAYGTHLYAVARRWGLGVSHVITTGNECDIDLAECIAWAAASEEVEVIAAYAEGVRDGPALLRALALARTNRKPVIFMKVGRSAAGAAAARSHTASLAGADEIYDAVLRQYGAHRAETTEEMLDIAYACTARIFPAGRRIGLITISGGVGAQMADHAGRLGLDVAPMPEPAQAALRSILPFAAPRNPVDTTAQIFNDVTLIGRNFAIMLAEGGYDVVVAFFTVAAASPFIVEPLLRELNAIRASFPDRLIFLSLVGPPEIVARYRDAGYLTFEDPCRAIAAAAAVVGFGSSFASYRDADASKEIARTPRTPPLPARPLSEWESRALLAEAGIPLVAARLAASAGDAAAAATEFGCPVAMKVNGPAFRHKTEIGGVRLDVAAPDAAYRCYGELVGVGGKHAPVDGIIVAPMVKGGVETIIGVTVDPVFGPAVMFGLGGVFVEVLKDVAFRLAPIGRDDAFAMISAIKGVGLLQGARGAPPADVAALADALVALSRFAAGHADDLASVELNPVLVMPEGQGVVALDCLVVPGSG